MDRQHQTCICTLLDSPQTSLIKNIYLLKNCTCSLSLSVVMVVVKVTEVSHAVTETIDHPDDSCHSNSHACHVTLPPEVDIDDHVPKAETARKTEVSWRPHQQCITSSPRRSDVISDVFTGNKMATVNYRHETVLTAL